MGNVWAITVREVKAYFASPIAYAVIAIFMVLTGYVFSIVVTLGREATLRDIFSNISTIMLFITPALTMRLLAEEQRLGTIELLLTSPLRDIELVLGKFFGSFVLFLAMLALTLYYPAILFLVGNPEAGPIASGYLGLASLGASFLAIGLFASSLTQNQIVAAFVCFGILLLLWLIDLASNIPGLGAGYISEFLSYANLRGHIRAFNIGIVDSRDLVYFLSLTAIMLFLTIRMLDSRRWA